MVVIILFLIQFFMFSFFFHLFVQCATINNESEHFGWRIVSKNRIIQRYFAILWLFSTEFSLAIICNLILFGDFSRPDLFGIQSLETSFSLDLLNKFFLTNLSLFIPELCTVRWNKSQQTTCFSCEQSAMARRNHSFLSPKIDRDKHSSTLRIRNRRIKSQEHKYSAYVCAFALGSLRLNRSRSRHGEWVFGSIPNINKYLCELPNRWFSCAWEYTERFAHGVGVIVI